MHLLVALLTVASCLHLDGTSAISQPQYHPPGSLQPYYKLPPPVFSSVAPPIRPAEHHKTMFTYAEVYTPYYRYHYYSPVYKDQFNQPPPFDIPSPVYSDRNDANSYKHREYTPPPTLFYPTTTSIPIRYPEASFQNNGLPPQNRPDKPLYPPTLNSQGITFKSSKPLFVKNVYAPSFGSYQTTAPNTHPPDVSPISTPIELASEFPNILRERSDKARLLEKISRYKPQDGPNLAFTPTSGAPFYPANRPLIVIPDSVATPSSTIIKDEVRRGIAHEREFRGQNSNSHLKNNSEEPVSIRKTLQPTSLLQSSSTKALTEYSDNVSDMVPATVISIPNFKSPKQPPSHISNFTTNLSTEIEVNDVPTEELLEPLDVSTLSPRQITTKKTDTTVSHLQKIAKKVTSTEAPKKKIFKHPNALFFAPGHDIPN